MKFCNLISTLGNVHGVNMQPSCESNLIVDISVERESVTWQLMKTTLINMAH